MDDLKVLLNSIDNDVIIDNMEDVLEILNMKKKIKQVQKMHPYAINHTEKSGWFTIVDDITAKGGKRKIRKATEEKLWNALIKWYLEKTDKNISLENLYKGWLDWKRTPRNASNIKRLEDSWKAYYSSEPISKDLISKPMASITSLELRTWAEKLMKKHYPVDQKKFSRMFTIVNQCYEYAADEDIAVVSENIWQKAKKKINKDLFVATVTPSDESQVFTDEERLAIRQMVTEDLKKYKKQPTSAGLQILFLFETGLRIGECCGLKWTDIKNNRLYIQRQADNNGVKEWTKTVKGFRDIPLTDEARNILKQVKEYNQAHNFNAEWIFQSDNPDYDYRLSYNAADKKLRKLCKRLDTVTKSPHKCRKTCVSTLLDNPNVNNRTVQRFAGHRDIATTLKYYNFDRSSKEQQAEAINDALKLG